MQLWTRQNPKRRAVRHPAGNRSVSEPYTISIKYLCEWSASKHPGTHRGGDPSHRVGATWPSGLLKGTKKLQPGISISTLTVCFGRGLSSSGHFDELFAVISHYVIVTFLYESTSFNLPYNTIPKVCMWLPNINHLLFYQCCCEIDTGPLLSGECRERRLIFNTERQDVQVRTS